MSIDKVIQEMRWCQQWPIAQGWADEIEAARTQPVGEVGYAWRGASTSQGTHYGVPFVLLSETHVSAGTKLFALPPDVEAAVQEGDAWGRELVVRNRELTDALDEIERLNNFVNGMKGIANTQGEIIAEQNEEIERLRELLVDAQRVLEWGEPEPKPVLRRIEAGLAEKEMKHE